VVTDKGTIHTEHVVNAGGLWAREVGAMAGVYLPLHPMEHQYIVTDEIPEIYDRDAEHPHVMDPAGESYLRQEGRGLCIGFYEQPCKPWAVDGTPWDFGHELLPDNLDKIEASIEFAYRRFPVLEKAGVKSVIHGPFTFAPDGNPLVGPIPGLRGYWSACGVMAGFGDWIGPGYTRPKVIENYQKRFSVSYPNEELPAARPLRQTPMYEVFDRMGAVWGAQYGLEVVNYFAEGYGASSSEAIGQQKEPRFETPSFRRSNAWEATAREVRAVREGVGINEVHNFGKYLVTGPGARDWLDRIMAGRIPAPGRLSLTPMLSHKGRLWGDFTVSCLDDETFQLTASYGAQAVHMRWFQQNGATGVHVENISDRLTGFQIAGPKAREVLMACTRDPLGEMRFMDVRRATLGMVDCRVQRVSYTGDLGYEIYCDPMAQRALWQVLWSEGQKHGMRPFGMRAMMSLRLDRFFGSWLSEFSPDYTPGETGMDRFIAWTKNTDFIGRAAAEAERAKGAARRLVAFEVDAADADVNGYEPVWIDGTVRGFCTSGGYSHHAAKSIALALIPAEMARTGLEAEIEILGDRRGARLITEPLFDADGARMRG
jgi:dimethylglycine dehydrogenase